MGKFLLVLVLQLLKQTSLRHIFEYFNKILLRYQVGYLQMKKLKMNLSVKNFHHH